MLLYSFCLPAWVEDSFVVNILNFLSSSYQAWDYSPEVGLVVAGGSSPWSRTVHISTDHGRTYSLLTNLPYGSYYVQGACILIVNETTLFVAGGKEYNYEQALTYFFNLNTNSWVRGPDLTERKQYHTCSLVTQPDGTRDVVVVGGYRAYSDRYQSDCYYQRSVDIINLDTNTKQRGKRRILHHNLNTTHFSFVLGQNLPVGLYGHTAVSYGRKVIIIGGNEGYSCTSSRGYSKAVYE